MAKVVAAGFVSLWESEQVFEVLPGSAKETFSKAIESLKKRLQPVANEALSVSMLNS